jgi:hypothetical protein
MTDQLSASIYCSWSSEEILPATGTPGSNFTFRFGAMSHLS